MTPLLQEIFNHEFTSDTESAQFAERFFKKNLGLDDLHRIFQLLEKSQFELDGRTIPAAMRIAGKDSEAPPFMLITMLHGNEPAGLAGALLCMALSNAGLLERDVIAIIGNPLAARQYFKHRLENPDTRQEVRDAYRCGLSKDGTLLADLNRIPVDFLERDPSDHHTGRAQELFFVGQHACGALDIHTARGNMTCITDYKNESELKDSPIRAVLTGLADAIAAHASATVKVKTLKTTMQILDNIKAQVGIEAGRHEDPECPKVAASFTLSLLHTLGLTEAEPLFQEEDGVFDGYAVQPKLTYADLEHDSSIPDSDEIFMVRRCNQLTELPEDCDNIMVKTENGVMLQDTGEYQENPAGTLAYAPYQYDEMEAIEEDQVVAVAVPSGVELRAKENFSGIFFSKSGALYDIDPSVGPWPIKGSEAANIKFCYPCKVQNFKPDFAD